jgi:hypothetical protein
VLYLVIACISFWYMDLGQFLYTTNKIEIQAFLFLSYLSRTAVMIIIFFGNMAKLFSNWEIFIRITGNPIIDSARKSERVKT